MEVLRYSADMSAGLAASYNRLVHGLPYCYPVTAREFASAAQVDDEASRSGLAHDAVLVAVDGSAPLGFLHVAVTSNDDDPQGLTRFFWYDRGQRVAGQALLVAAEEHVRAHGADQMEVFHQNHRYPIYHMRHVWGSDRLEHVHALLHHNDYRRRHGEIYLDWPDYDPIAPATVDIAFDIGVEWETGGGSRKNLRVKAVRDGEMIGECHSDSCGEYSRVDEAQDRIYTVGLGVEREFQGKGLGRHLMRRSLVEARDAGYRHAVISTNQENHRARLFYSNFGYHPVDWTYSLYRRFD
ncbi:hypothetical protein CMK11_05085 [Candidatus Poribacteria bacterium]|nr:hypothetical protein [Candidatus Poribacteria bacterium]